MITQVGQPWSTRTRFVGGPDHGTTCDMAGAGRYGRVRRMVAVEPSFVRGAPRQVQALYAIEFHTATYRLTGWDVERRCWVYTVEPPLGDATNLTD